MVKALICCALHASCQESTMTHWSGHLEMCMATLSGGRQEPGLLHIIEKMFQQSIALE